MANRTARLRRETETHVREERLQTALRNSKQKQRKRRSTRQLTHHLDNRLCLRNELQSRMRTLLLRRKSLRRSFERHPNFFLIVMYCLGSGEFLQRLEGWRAPRSADPARIFKSLAGHLFIRFPVPKVLLNGTIRTLYEEQAIQYRPLNWFLHVAAGYNLSRATGLPFEVTKKTAHQLAETPEQLTLYSALRWAQVRALGGNAGTAQAIADVLTEAEPEMETRWTDMIRFVVRNADDLAPEWIPRIVKFLRGQHFGQVIHKRGIKDVVEPLFPAFDVRQATVKSLCERVVRWEQYVEQCRSNLDKKPFPVPKTAREACLSLPFGTVRIVRLVHIQDLLTEGVHMSNCVATYGAYCHEGKGSIWSFRSDSFERPMATLELNAAGKIVQLLGKANSVPTPEVVEAARIWADRNRLHW